MQGNNKEDNNKTVGVIHHAPIARSMDMRQISAFGDRMQLVTNVGKEGMLAKYASKEDNEEDDDLLQETIGADLEVVDCVRRERSLSEIYERCNVVLGHPTCVQEALMKKEWKDPRNVDKLRHELEKEFEMSSLGLILANIGHGMPFWEYGGHDTNIGNFFNDAMASDARLVTAVVIDKCKDVFEGLESLVDVGGGTGTVAKAIPKAFPNTECTVFDLPHVVADLQGANNVKYVGGDMFEAVPPADAILLKWILHDWSDEESVKILKKCKEAITGKGNKGKVIIIDMMMENKKGDEETIETQLFFDMLMMVLVTGKERNEKEWTKLFSDAGFRNYKITPILGLRSLIEVYP
ncbi:probable O-methyltransferase 3 [Ziziphus jujuba]|uniref:Probable O-methyltransferase 3 n=1 Tax=Ziziphus jujuba TaxID=326968 RepID=A0ABM4A7R7_ZIZJJ|nr:probable O-methyltransferase 3 [Ziziphus jujuba]